MTQAARDRTSTNAPVLHRWTRREYDRLVDAGLFHQRHVELIEGQIFDMSPMGSTHATVVKLVDVLLQAAYGSDYFTRVQMPLALGDYSEPEPDIAVVRGQVRDFVLEHPTTALLVVEVSDSTLEFDRQTKGSLYAMAGVAHYWVVNVRDRCLEVFGDPEADEHARYGWAYASKDALPADASISLPMLAGKRLSIAELLP